MKALAVARGTQFDWILTFNLYDFILYSRALLPACCQFLRIFAKMSAFSEFLLDSVRNYHKYTLSTCVTRCVHPETESGQKTEKGRNTDDSETKAFGISRAQEFLTKEERGSSFAELVFCVVFVCR